LVGFGGGEAALENSFSWSGSAAALPDHGRRRDFLEALRLSKPPNGNADRC